MPIASIRISSIPGKANVVKNAVAAAMRKGFFAESILKAFPVSILSCWMPIQVLCQSCSGLAAASAEYKSNVS